MTFCVTKNSSNSANFQKRTMGGVAEKKYDYHHPSALTTQRASKSCTKYADRAVLEFVKQMGCRRGSYFQEVLLLLLHLPHVSKSLIFMPIFITLHCTVF